MEDAITIIQKLNEQLPDSKINFDLEDCDKILRIESHSIDLVEIKKLLHKLNCKFELLE